MHVCLLFALKVMDEFHMWILSQKKTIKNSLKQFHHFVNFSFHFPNRSTMESSNINQNNEFRFESDTVSLEDIRQQVVEKTQNKQSTNTRNLFLDLFDSVGQISSKFRDHTDNDCKVGLPEWSDDERKSLETAVNVTMEKLIKLSDKCQIDLADATLKKMDKNRQKYPVEKAFGMAKKYNEL